MEVHKMFTGALASLIITISGNVVHADGAAGVDAQLANLEAKAILKKAEKESGRKSFDSSKPVQFKKEFNVYLKSSLAVDFTYRKAYVQLPLYRGIQGNGEEAFYVLTEASDAAVAKTLGVNLSTKLSYAIGSKGAQAVELIDGTMIFKGSIDFSPVREIAPGSPTPFPPSKALPGAIADSAWSSVVVLPSGVVLNAQIVSNKTGIHDRALEVNTKNYTTKMSLLDGFQDGKQFFYHLVTDVSADVPAALENGVYAPALAELPEIGKSTPNDFSALLGFSPVLNGISDLSTGQDQGFESLLVNGGIDPINVFPYGPDNANYSPLWDAHVSQWTQSAVNAGLVRRIISFDDLGQLIQQGLVESAFINPEAPGNPWLFNLRPTRAIINCPVIAHPEASAI